MTQWNFACPDWEDRLRRGETPITDLPLNTKEAQAAVDLFDALRLPDVPGQPPQREAAGDWQRDIVAAAFGSVDKATGIRHVGEVFCLVPKKNAKTTGGAGIALTFMLRNARPRASMILIAPTQKIADTAFEQAAGMVDAGLDIPGVEKSWLKDRLHVRDHLKRIECQHTKSVLEIKTFDTKIVTGSKPVFVLVDETHELGTIASAEKVFRQLRGGQDPFPESLFVQITTQSDGRPSGVFKTELQYARSVRDGTAEGVIRTLPVLYEFPEAVQTSKEQDWKDPVNWHLVNPNMGRSTSLDALKAGYDRSRADGEGALRGWATQHLNVEVGLALHSDRWGGADHWERAGDRKVTFDAIMNRCDVVTAGIDGGGLDDLMALAVIGRERETRRWLHWAHAWAHPEVYERRKELAPILDGFRRDGDLTLVTDDKTSESGIAQDHEEIGQRLLQIYAAGLFPAEWAVGIDPAQVTALIDALILMGLPETLIAQAPQWASKLSPAIWGIERKLKYGDFVHGDQPLMSWAVENAVAEQRGNAVLITKQVSGKAKIDPLAATLDAAMMMQLNPAATGNSVYKTRGALVL